MPNQRTRQKKKEAAAAAAEAKKEAAEKMKSLLMAQSFTEVDTVQSLIKSL